LFYVYAIKVTDKNSASSDESSRTLAVWRSLPVATQRGGPGQFSQPHYNRLRRHYPPHFIENVRARVYRIIPKLWTYYSIHSINQFICPEMQYTLDRPPREDATSANSRVL